MPGLFARPAAALSSGLLARKGQARPAMRSQNLVGFSTGAGALDDLGWNDMGQAAVLSMPELEPEPAPDPLPEPEFGPGVNTVPQVLVERDVLHHAMVEARKAPVPEVVREAPAKAAFTLRLNAERHLRLRLASAAANRSAQALVTDALDALLAQMPEVETLAAQLPEPPSKRKSGA